MRHYNAAAIRERHNMTTGRLGDALERYERTSDGKLIIDVSAARVEDLYSNFDRSAPYVRRDLDEDLADYLIACAG